jgi:hypothetical protein
MKIKDNISDNHLTIANNFNIYFLSVVNNLIDENIIKTENLISDTTDPLKYLHNTYT